MLTGEAKRNYMREYMRRRRAANGAAERPPGIRADKSDGAGHEIARLRARVAELEAELEAVGSPRTPGAGFSDKGKLRIEDAIRVHKDRLSKQFEQRVNEEVRSRIAAADDATRNQNKALRAENLYFAGLLGQRGVFSPTEFKKLLMCVHPDNPASEGVRNETLALLVKHEERLVKPIAKESRSPPAMDVADMARNRAAYDAKNRERARKAAATRAGRQ